MAIYPYYLQGATISPCKKYRYDLIRCWASITQPLGVIMLNPSKADASKDDSTIKKLFKIARNNGFGGIEVVNLFALRSTDPTALTTSTDPVGDKNYEYIDRIVEELGAVSKILIAWGSHKVANPEAERLFNRHPDQEFYCLKINADGNPKHPLYCKDDSELIHFPNPAKQ